MDNAITSSILNVKETKDTTINPQAILISGCLGTGAILPLFMFSYKSCRVPCRFKNSLFLLLSL
jgi:hypothetical protein